MQVYPRKEKANKIRKEGKVPGVLYGPKIESTPIYTFEEEINNLYQEHEAGLFEFEFAQQKFSGLLREVQLHPLTQKIIHFDIYVPALEKEITAEIPIEFIGEAPVLKSGGVLNFALQSLEVEALPKDLPEKIVIDLSSLKEIGQTIYVKDLNLPGKIKILVEETTPIVTVIKEAEVETGETKETTQPTPPPTNV